MKRPAITTKMRLDVFKSYGAVCLCQICGNAQYIGDMPIDHHLALIDTGEHSVSNLRPVCSACHVLKSTEEHRNNCRAKRLAKKHSNPKPPGKIKSRPFQGSRKFNGEAVWRKS